MRSVRSFFFFLFPSLSISIAILTVQLVPTSLETEVFRVVPGLGTMFDAHLWHVDHAEEEIPKGFITYAHSGGLLDVYRQFSQKKS
jgi:hypothetical protein